MTAIDAPCEILDAGGKAMPGSERPKLACLRIRKIIGFFPGGHAQSRQPWEMP